MNPPGPGPFEAGVLKAFADPGWKTANIEQTGPDGTEVLMVIYFHICPNCAALVPPADGEPFLDLHRDYHISQAQMLDEMLAAITGALGVKQTCTFPGCETTEGLVAPPPGSSSGFRCADHPAIPAVDA